MVGGKAFVSSRWNNAECVVCLSLFPRFLPVSVLAVLSSRSVFIASVEKLVEFTGS